LSSWFGANDYLHAKTSVDVMRRKAGDTEEDGDKD
jgi:hypothetical protein